ncbi:MAG: DASS family sodium-coupled anion symporter [Chlamydiia bacterium]|nr:DASS family sodium-coupled anion symporter [Chlamydiia bacterium]
MGTPSKEFNEDSIHWIPLGGIVALGLLLQLAPVPNGLTEQAWSLFIIFALTILALILKPLPMGAVAFLSLTTATLTRTLSITDVFIGYAQKELWLIVFACFIARAFIKTGLAARIAYLMLAAIGRTTIGLGYAFMLSGLILAPAMPSSTARAGGILVPIMRALSLALGSHPNDPSSIRIGTYLAMIVFHSTVLGSAIFLTGMAPNPILTENARSLGVEISWMLWFKAAIVPGALCALLLPWVIRIFAPPTLTETKAAVTHAKEKLEEMGSIRLGEWKMIICLVGLLSLWIFGRFLGIDPTAAAMVGVSFLLLTEVLTWTDLIQERNAWETLFWFAALLVMATQLNTLGFIPWFTSGIEQFFLQARWEVVFACLLLIYFYSHYLFASIFAHISSMFLPFLALCISAGTPPVLASLALAHASGLFGGITHYSSGQAPIVFSEKYVPVGLWWKTGFVVCSLSLLIWCTVGFAWWKWLGIW